MSTTEVNVSVGASDYVKILETFAPNRASSGDPLAWTYDRGTWGPG